VTARFIHLICCSIWVKLRLTNKFLTVDFRTCWTLERTQGSSSSLIATDSQKWITKGMTFSIIDELIQHPHLSSVISYTNLIFLKKTVGKVSVLMPFNDPPIITFLSWNNRLPCDVIISFLEWRSNTFETGETDVRESITTFSLDYN